MNLAGKTLPGQGSPSKLFEVPSVPSAAQRASTSQTVFVPTSPNLDTKMDAPADEYAVYMRSQSGELEMPPERHRCEDRCSPVGGIAVVGNVGGHQPILAPTPLQVQVAQQELTIIQQERTIIQQERTIMQLQQQIVELQGPKCFMCIIT